MGRLDVLAEISDERNRQDKKWGVQDHPSVCDDGDFGVVSEETAKTWCDYAAEIGELTWSDIALEEFAEAVHAPNDEKRREELIQLAAVICAWVECIDRRETSGAV